MSPQAVIVRDAFVRNLKEKIAERRELIRVEGELLAIEEAQLLSLQSLVCQFDNMKGLKNAAREI